MDLIYAEATPPGRGGVSIIRISGAGARRLAEHLAGALPRPRHAYLREIRDTDEILDRALVMWFEEGHSFTGEELAEIHLHGAPVIVRRLGQILTSRSLRLAEAGEFTRRAFLNGRMDLSEVEGLGDLLAAETEAQRRLALRVSSGELARKADHWRSLLIRAGALVESSVDFADEDVPEDVPGEVFELLAELRRDLKEQIAGYAAAERIRNGFEVAVIGPPNAGKSSLINRIARREVALVSDIAGTTRDIIELRLDIRGLAVTLLDTAGLRTSEDVVENLGIDRARTRAAGADLRLHLSPEGKKDDSLWQEGDILVATKSDLHKRAAGLPVSSLTSEGLDLLINQVFDTLSVRAASAALISHQRQLTALSEAYEGLAEVDNLPPELVAEAIRRTASSLDRLLGRIGAEDYLDVIFTSFCIGK
ncbi:tRNA uridine-5-carboxymethylaminomethyl(34) synthesis GTPase MnmE [Paracoccus sp. WLY502]|uniref:tRNA uridine-5-carboxymethylaminomethyl(34) synthesis GTPase MnmE n=1 Tax=Paracoccus yibinensis TaxID=3068891 RepID=UPI0027968ADC|nr:tRNA uridine-5-carboxymethylaminomethyl(34) synthesis GTPase MnmE [Paracoccus sp. WLY502]MDQ1901304.1 tRNA uridine-5-carboxymethylaminomethyl(34) synthesis GTPase MnmE [Paracoccus sp. WLY502]